VLELLDLLLHRGNCLFLLRHLELQFALYFLARLFARGIEALLDSLFDRQVRFAQLGVELALLAQEVGLGFLCFSELGVVLGKVLLQLGDRAGFLLEFVGERPSASDVSRNPGASLPEAARRATRSA
jgi:hypothetical protein